MNRLSQMGNYSTQTILQQLDQCAQDFTFPMLDNGYVHLIDARLSAYRDALRWVLIIEVVGFNVRAGGHDGIDNCLHIFGNCLEYEPGTNNSNFLYITGNSPDGETFDTEYGETINPNANFILLRDTAVPIAVDRGFYRAKGIELEDPLQVKIWEYLRSIQDDYRELFFATEDEIRQRIPEDIPRILRLDEWFHIDLANSEKPSENETFQMIAKVLETGNQSMYCPTRPPNTNWKNWPDGGAL